MFEDVRHERLLLLFLSSVEPFMLQQSKLTDHEANIIANIAAAKVHAQRLLKGHVAVTLLG